MKTLTENTTVTLPAPLHGGRMIPAQLPNGQWVAAMIVDGRFTNRADAEASAEWWAKRTWIS